MRQHSLTSAKIGLGGVDRLSGRDDVLSSCKGLETPRRASAIRDYTKEAILQATAEVFSNRGEGASMAEIAEVSGVARATLYRYFPNRECLLDALMESALADLEKGICQSDLESVELGEAVARLTRVFFTLSSKYNYLVRSGVKKDRVKEFRLAVKPALEGFKSAQRRGLIRQDIPADICFNFYLGVTKSAFGMLFEGGGLLEDMVSQVTRFVLSALVTTEQGDL